MTKSQERRHRRPFTDKAWRVLVDMDCHPIEYNDGRDMLAVKGTPKGAQQRKYRNL